MRKNKIAHRPFAGDITGATEIVQNETMPTPISDDETLEKLTNDEIVHLQKEFAHLIDAVAVRIHYAETRRSTYSVIGGALIASGITARGNNFIRAPFDNRVIHRHIKIAYLIWSDLFH